MKELTTNDIKHVFHIQFTPSTIICSSPCDVQALILC